MVHDWNCYIFAIFGTVIIRCTKTFWSLCIILNFTFLFFVLQSIQPLFLRYLTLEFWVTIANYVLPKFPFVCWIRGRFTGRVCPRGWAGNLRPARRVWTSLSKIVRTAGDRYWSWDILFREKKQVENINGINILSSRLSLPEDFVKWLCFEGLWS
jgi:hypothetical protein